MSKLETSICLLGFSGPFTPALASMGFAPHVSAPLFGVGRAQALSNTPSVSRNSLRAAIIAFERRNLLILILG